MSLPPAGLAYAHEVQRDVPAGGDPRGPGEQHHTRRCEGSRGLVVDGDTDALQCGQDRCAGFGERVGAHATGILVYGPMRPHTAITIPAEAEGGGISNPAAASNPISPLDPVSHTLTASW